MLHTLKKKVSAQLFHPHLMPISHLFKPLYSGVGSILMFHRVISDDAPYTCPDLEIKESYLEEIIHWFQKENYDFVSLDRAYELIQRPEKKKFVAFTFDDGYVDNLTLAYPIFKKYTIPFTIYVTTSFPDQTAQLWWYALRDLVDESEELTFTFPKTSYTFSTLTPEDKHQTYHRLRNLIVNTPKEKLTGLFHQLFTHNVIDLSDYTEDLALNWTEIIALSEDELVTIGAHTTNHYNLRQLSLDDLQNEVMASKQKIEDKINKPVLHFAYPYGSQNEASIREFQTLKDLGFKTSTTTRCGNIFPAHSNHLTSLPRLAICPHLTSPYIPYYTSGFIPAMSNKMRRSITD